LSAADWHDRAGKLRYETRHPIDGKYVESLLSYTQTKSAWINLG
jgi:hypothetical protein